MFYRIGRSITKREQFDLLTCFIFSTADFRNAFLKTIRQIIRESVRNMSIPSTKQVSHGILIIHGHKGNL